MTTFGEALTELSNTAPKGAVVTEGESIHELASVNTVDGLRTRWFALQELKVIKTKELLEIEADIKEWFNVISHARDLFDGLIPGPVSNNSVYNFEQGGSQ